MSRSGQNVARVGYATSSGQEFHLVVQLLLPVAVTLVLWMTTSNPVTPVANLCSLVLLQLVWTTCITWSRRNQGGLPLFSLVGFAYWVYFAFPVYVGGREIATVTRSIPVTEEAVTRAVEMALLGVSCMFAGMKIRIFSSAVSKSGDVDMTTPFTWTYLRFVMMAGTVASFFPSFIYILGSEFRQVTMILVSIVPTAALAILLVRYWRGKGSAVDGPLLIIAIGLRIAGALASGWLGPILALGITICGIYVVVRRSVPWAAILVTIGCFLFLQVGKTAFRDTFWDTGRRGAAFQETPLSDRVQFWIEESFNQWSTAFGGDYSSSSGRLVVQAAQRASLLTQVAHVLDVTPSEVPYQGGQTYSYLAITLIPRFLWPDKPSINEANQFYQVAYGLTDPKSLQYVSISVGAMAEAYINFGWIGVAGMMFAIGLLLQLYDRYFLSNHRNLLMSMIGITLLPQFLSIEGQLGVYIGGLLQQILLTFLALLVITIRPSRIGGRIARYTAIPRSNYPGRA